MNGRMITSVMREYGVEWMLNRGIYSGRLKLMSAVAASEKLFEKKAAYPSRLDIFPVDTGRIAQFLRHLPQEKKQELIRVSDHACEGRIWGFSSMELDYGNPLDWQLNPLTERRCDERQKWYEIPDFDESRGDIKVPWEASRFSHFLTLSRAFLLTGDKKYYTAFSRQLADWIEKNPYSLGANFKCGQECSLRLVNALLAYTVFAGEGAAAEEDKKNLETLILRCYRKIRSNFFYAYKCIKNNHTISELMGMIIGAWCCGEEDILSYAYATLDRVIEEQFTDDGGYRQFSFNYQRLALQDLEVVLSVSPRVGKSLSAASKKKILAGANLMYQCQDEGGDMPNYGSNDGALVFPVTSCGYRDFRPVINTVHAILTGKSLYEAGEQEEELLWFGGGASGQDQSRRGPSEGAVRVSTAYHSAGLYTLRASHSWAMMVCTDYRSRPAHMDQLHFDLWIKGVNVLCDCGTYSYASDEGRRMATDLAHNTAAVENHPQMNTHGAFLVYDWTRRGRVKHTDRLFYGEYASGNGYEHGRMVEVTDRGYRITDKVALSAGGRSTYKILFHTPCEVSETDGGYELKAGGKPLCRIKSSAGGSREKAFRSLYYLRKEEITCLAFLADKDTVVTEIEVVGQEK